MKLKISTIALPIGLVVCSTATPQTLPNAGSLNQQVEREQPPQPARTPPQIRTDRAVQAAVAGDDKQKILVKALRINGAKAYSETALLALTGFKGERELTLSELRGMAAKVTEHYRAHGYFLAQAYLPAQEVKDGALRIDVIEGQYGKLELRNSSGVSDALVNDLMAGLQPGEAVTIAPLENRLLLLSDLPGVNVKSSLVPGASVGVSDLIVEVAPGSRVSGGLDVDNEGNRYTGTKRVGGNLTINNPIGQGDALHLRLQTSLEGLQYQRASYQAQIGRTKAGVVVSHMRYKLGEEFASLQAHGTAQIATAFASYPLVRSRNKNLTLQLAYDLKEFKDRVDATATSTDKDARVWSVGLAGDSRDGLGGGGFNRYAVTLTSGSISIGTPAALAVDAATARSNGHFNKLSFQVSRLQGITDRFSLYASLSGQTASKNLDTSEKMGLGGAGGVRAYPAGEAYGDRGYVLNLETRYLLPKFSENMPGQMQLIGFIDNGSVSLNKSPWTAGENRRTLSGGGFGLNWVVPDNFFVSAYFAHRIGSARVTSAPDDKSRFLLQGVKSF